MNFSFPGSILFSSKKEIDYIFVFAPIFLAHIFIPPLSYFAGTDESIEILEQIYLCIPKLSDPAYIKSLLLCPSIHKFPQDSQYFTHLFVHGTYAHMIGNLYTAYISGRSVFHEFGAYTFYFLYFSGGIVASLPSKFSLDNQKYIHESIKDTFKIDQSILPNIFKDMWNRTIPELGKQIMSSQFLPRYACGSSGATCALLGASIVICVRDLFLSPLIQYIRKYGLRQYSYDAEDPQRKAAVATIGYPFFSNIFTLFTSVTYLLNEYSLMHPTKESLSSSSFHSRLLEILETSKIGHVAHVQGAVWGASFAFCFGVAVPYGMRLWHDKKQTPRSYIV